MTEEKILEAQKNQPLTLAIVEAKVIPIERLMRGAHGSYHYYPGYAILPTTQWFFGDKKDATRRNRHQSAEIFVLATDNDGVLVADTGEGTSHFCTSIEELRDYIGDTFFFTDECLYKMFEDAERLTDGAFPSPFNECVY